MKLRFMTLGENKKEVMKMKQIKLYVIYNTANKTIIFTCASRRLALEQFIRIKRTCPNEKVYKLGVVYK